MIAMLNPAFNFGNAESAYCKPFAEVCVECKTCAVFVETRADNQDDDKTLADIASLATHRGPFKVSIAHYGRKGDPRITSTEARRIRNEDHELAERLMNLGVPTKLAGMICGITAAALYNRARRTAQARYRDRIKGRGNICQPAADVVADRASNEGRRE